MSYRSQFCLAVSPAFALALAVSVTAAPPAAHSAKAPAAAGKYSAESARLATYEKASGERYFALSLVPKVTVEPTKSHDVIVLVDTSASQTGLYREDSLAITKALLLGLGEEDRIRLFAVDVTAVPLTAEFVSPESAEAKKALGSLNRRVPLGSTDMGAALQAAVNSFSNKTANPRAVVYIGDGFSKASLLSPGELSELQRSLVAKRIAVSSFAIGQQCDIQLLATLANHTGGMVLLDTERASATEMGIQLAKFARAPVIWPTSAKYSSALVEVFPKVAPPLRLDRDTILLGTLGAGGAQQIAMTAELNGKQIDLSWKVSPEASNDDFAFLPKVLDLARKDGGSILPTVGSAGLLEVSRVFLAGAQDLSKLSSQALASGDRDGAKRLAEAALKLDPESGTAAAVRRAADKPDVEKKESEKKEPAKPAAPKLNDGAELLPEGLEPAVSFIAFADEPPAAGDEGALLKAFEEKEGEFLGSVESAKRIITGKVKAEIEEGLTNARKKIGANAEQVKRDLKLLLENVERAIDLEADIRAQLRDQIESSLKEASRREIEESEKRANNEEAQAAARERQLLVEETTRRDAKVKQLMDRFNSLMDEGRYDEAEGNIAEQVRRMEDPPRPYSEATVWYARNKGNVLKMYALREHRHKNFVDTLFSAERSHVPFPDDPPIVYPDAEVWEELSLRRKKYQSMDVAKQGSTETKILTALNDPTTLEFIETPLKDVIDYLKDLHGIEIQIDTKALDGVGVSSDTPVTRNLKGISLRSALRLMLKELELTYMIKNEVLQITTPEVADNALVTKVYPVGDLVLPIPLGMGSSGMGMMGGMGGMNGMNGMGGGMGGMGGGMGMGGMGGGMMGGMMGMNVEDDLRLGVKKPETPKAERPVVQKPIVQKPAVQRPSVAKPAAQKPAAIAKPGEQNPIAENAPSATIKYASEKPRRINLSTDNGDSAEEAWTNYFAGQVAQGEMELPASIRLTVRELMSAKEYDEAIALLHGALRGSQAHSWMYEALALAVQARHLNEPEVAKPELERALLSAIDFSQSLDDMMFVATYMTRVGLDERALNLLRKVSFANPQRPEPYLQGLEAAKRLDDIPGIQWACAGILGQAWPREQRKIFENAVRVAEATVLRLTMEQRLDEAKQFKAAMNQALVRDCKVIVSWTGDADIDLYMAEPTGTVCSLRNPRSAGGGVMIGDSFSRPGKATTEGYSEIYNCPQGFSGEYKLAIKRIWGKVTAGKVTVTVITNSGTENEKQERQQVPLTDNALVVFELKDGRRTEPLGDLQAATAAENQVAISRAILVQQLSAAESSQARADYDKAVRGGAGADGVAPRARPGVGFRPQITVLPEGVNMTALGVISADRRYVRVSIFSPNGQPVFSQIGNVSTFNFASGGMQNGMGGGNMGMNMGGGMGFMGGGMGMGMMGFMGT